MTSRIAYCRCGAAVYVDTPLNAWNGRPAIEVYYRPAEGSRRGEHITCCPGCRRMLNQNSVSRGEQCT